MRGLKRTEFGLGWYRSGQFPETYLGERIGTLGDRPYRCLATAAWVEPHKLYLRVCVTDDYLGGLQVTLSHVGGELAIHMTKVAEWFLDDYQGFAGGRALPRGVD